MQCCSAPTLLRLARCCHATLRAATQDFAWRNASPLPLRVPQFCFAWQPEPPPPETVGVLRRLLSRFSKRPAPLLPGDVFLLALQSSPLLRGRNLAVSWVASSNSRCTDAVVEHTVLSLARLPVATVAQMDVTAFPERFETTALRALQAAPGMRECMAGLISLRIMRSHFLSNPAAHLPAAFPSLRTLRVDQGWGGGRDERMHGRFELLASLPELTELKLAMRDGPDECRSAIEAIMRCHYLRNLRVTGLHPRTFLELPRAALLCHSLETVELCFASDELPVNCSAEAASGLAAALAQLHRMHTLTVCVQGDMLEGLLRVLAAARPPVLRCVHVEMLSLSEASVPRAATVDELLGALPDLSLSLSCEECSLFDHRSGSREQWTAGLVALRALVHERDPRVRLEVTQFYAQLALMARSLEAQLDSIHEMLPPELP